MLRSDSVMSKVLCVILHVLLACTVPPLPLLLRRSTVRRRSSSARWRACKGTQPSCSPQPTNSPTARPPFAERDPVQEAVAYLYQQTNGFHWACPLRRLQHQHNIQVEHMLESLVQQVKLMLANPNPAQLLLGRLKAFALARASRDGRRNRDGTKPNVWRARRLLTAHRTCSSAFSILRSARPFDSHSRMQLARLRLRKS